MVVGGANADMLAAEAVRLDSPVRSASSVGAAAAHDVWRITGSRDQQISIQVHSEPAVAGGSTTAVAVCELREAAADEACWEHGTSSIRVTTAGVHPDVTVRVGRSPTRNTPVLVTIAYISG